MRTEHKRVVPVTVEIAYSAVTCDKCGAEWTPPQPEGFSSERDFHNWKRTRDERYGGGDPDGWFAVAGPVGPGMKYRHICPECIKAFLPETT